MGAALALGVWQLKAAVDGPPEFNPPKGSLQGRTVLITGASSGLGFESAVRLAEAGARVVATARAEKVSGVEQALQEEVPQADVAVLPLDLADLNSIETFASQLDVRGIDVVVCNAGVMAVPERSETKDGFELQLGVNHLGHFALCGRLLPLLGASAESPCRVVCVSSLAHRLGDMQRLLQELELSDVASYNAWAAYSDSKLANVVFAKELNRRFQAAGAVASAVSLHPGLCATELARYVVSGKDEPLEVTYAQYAAPIQAALQASKRMLRPVRRGANSQVYLAAGADGGLDQSGGLYFQDMEPADAHSEADDPELGARFWEVQFFVGDLVECLRGGRWHCARVSRAPTDERPHDGSFRVKFDEDGKEMKCWYKDLRKVSRPVPAPPWLNSWQPEEAPPDEEGSWRHLEGPRHDAAASWRQGPPREALEISAAERRKEALLWEQHHVRSAKKKAEQEAITKEYARLCEERDRQEGELHFGREELEVSDDSEEETST
ncbi:unnamed protein product [Effrenium voratum]|uniref:Uncharacterized protein n=1 Tax=Effrenium voratum TaxID=2562239 RepID=A0AA36I0Y8_9DINO|nr:unnamed protein product [Effrenium voratum]